MVVATFGSSSELLMPFGDGGIINGGPVPTLGATFTSGIGTNPMPRERARFTTGSAPVGARGAACLVTARYATPMMLATATTVASMVTVPRRFIVEPPSV
jgi:hypothetical protein